MSEGTGERRLRVLMTTDVVGGVWDFSCAHTAELTRRGHNVTLLALGTPSPDQRRQAFAAHAKLLSAPLKLEWMQDCADDMDATRELAINIAESLQPDVIHANQFVVGDLTNLAPVVLTIHSDVLSWLKWNAGRQPGQPIPVEWRPYVGLVRLAIQAADAPVAVSQMAADDVIEMYGVARPIEVIHNGWPAPDEEPRPIAKRPRLSVVAGRAWDSAKNIGVAIEAARDRRLGRVVLLGDQRHPETGALATFDATIDTLGRVPREIVDGYLSEARAYVAPARYEPFGLLPLQAAVAGCPLLLSDIPSFRELWDGAALFFPTDDVAVLRGQWHRLLGDEGLAAELAERARDRARAQYSIARMTDAYLTLYGRLIAARRGAAGTRISA